MFGFRNKEEKFGTYNPAVVETNENDVFENIRKRLLVQNANTNTNNDSQVAKETSSLSYTNSNTMPVGNISHMSKDNNIKSNEDYDFLNDDIISSPSTIAANASYEENMDDEDDYDDDEEDEEEDDDAMIMNSNTPSDSSLNYSFAKSPESAEDEDEEDMDDEEEEDMDDEDDYDEDEEDEDDEVQTNNDSLNGTLLNSQASIQNNNRNILEKSMQKPQDFSNQNYATNNAKSANFMNASDAYNFDNTFEEGSLNDVANKTSTVLESALEELLQMKTKEELELSNSLNLNTKAAMFDVTMVILRSEIRRMLSTKLSGIVESIVSEEVKAILREKISHR